MVQTEANTTLTLKHLAAQGAVLSAEQQAALDYSLCIKRVEAGLKTLVLWGKVTALNGKDYLIAEGYNDAHVLGAGVLFETKYFYSQDGAKWVDLQAVDDDLASRAARIRGSLSGDASKNHELEEKDPDAPAAPAEGDEEAPKAKVYQIPELGILRQRIDAITKATGVIPANSMITDAYNKLVPNVMFSGSQFPEKLEAYAHRSVPPGGPTLAQDLRGSWSLQCDPFRGISLLRSLIWPGYYFYYDARQVTWGSLYVGDAVRNNDLIFML